MSEETTRARANRQPSIKGLTAKQVAAALASGQSAFAVKSSLPTMLLTVHVVRVEDGMAIVTGRAGEFKRRPAELVTLDTAMEARRAEQARIDAEWHDGAEVEP